MKKFFNDGRAKATLPHVPLGHLVAGPNPIWVNHGFRHIAYRAIHRCTYAPHQGHRRLVAPSCLHRRLVALGARHAIDGQDVLALGDVRTQQAVWRQVNDFDALDLGVDLNGVVDRRQMTFAELGVEGRSDDLSYGTDFVVSCCRHDRWLSSYDRLS